MKQENKQLLLKDLCARLPYGLKVKIKHYDDAWELLAIYTNGTTYATRDVGYPIETYFEDCKPYLFPLSSMTEEQKKYIANRWGINEDFDFEIDPNWGEYLVDLGDVVDYVNWLIENHFDFNWLIPKGLAIDATGLNIY